MIMTWTRYLVLGYLSPYSEYANCNTAASLALLYGVQAAVFTYRWGPGGRFGPLPKGSNVVPFWVVYYNP